MAASRSSSSSSRSITNTNVASLFTSLVVLVAICCLLKSTEAQLTIDTSNEGFKLPDLSYQLFAEQPPVVDKETSRLLGRNWITDARTPDEEPEMIHLSRYPIQRGISNSFGSQTPLTAVDLNQLIEYLSQSTSSPDGQQLLANNDINVHFPANGDTINGPVNDPEEFEAASSYLTNYINREVADKTISNDDNTEPSTSPSEPASRYGGGEYIDHPLALIGHQYVQGGAGEGRQLLGPDGTFENVQVIKSDHAVPSYCDPPNPCPIGYTTEDGCTERFVNSASFSREYQAKQQCSCDNEHSLFNCASPVSSLKDSNSIGHQQKQQHQDEDEHTNGNDDIDNTIDSDLHQQSKVATNHKLSTLARTIQNRFGGLAGVRELIAKVEGKQNQIYQDSLWPSQR